MGPQSFGIPKSPEYLGCATYRDPGEIGKHEAPSSEMSQKMKELAINAGKLLLALRYEAH